MRTCSSSNLPVESSPNPATSNPKRRNRRRSKQPYIFEESPIDTMADQRTIAELLRAPTEGYAEAIVEDERVEETLTDQDLAEYTIKVPPPLVQKPKPPSQRIFVVHQRDPFHPNIPYPSRMLKQKQQEKDEV
nr:hypothetical protein [Tanacetum cinerariifolium]